MPLTVNFFIKKSSKTKMIRWGLSTLSMFAEQVLPAQNRFTKIIDE